ncbi:nuclear transport factor 2 family protein [Oceanibacterium hippocampi]|uniref:SnoaL-like domain protein n=1 Tax=Oceanibacterium hippocampi TaxID=745714 RepID=A0A1Y5RXI2_9PROT|nr:nuclear transport factor 2 family protein [Oceanibacterium hippocampi]SLN27613.1 SnoaL-like domain protein [Oceanibacterium hippocampi]
MTTDPRVARWHRIVEERDMPALADILAPDVRFHAPVYWQPREGREMVHLLLSNVIEIFEDFVYHREMVQGDDCILEFSARIGDRQLKGVDLIRWGADGRIVDFEVMIRPTNAHQALQEAMAARIQAAMAARAGAG